MWVISRWLRRLPATTPLVSFLPLRPHRQQKHRVDSGHIAVQRHIATRGAADDQFPVAVFNGTPDQGAVGQYLDRLQDFANALGRRARVELGDVVKEAAKSTKT